MIPLLGKLTIDWLVFLSQCCQSKLEEIANIKAKALMWSEHKLGRNLTEGALDNGVVIEREGSEPGAWQRGNF